MNINHHSSKPVGTLWGLKSATRSFLLAQTIHPLGIARRFGERLELDSCSYHRSGGRILLDSVIKVIPACESEPEFNCYISSSNFAPYFEWNMRLMTDRRYTIIVDSLWRISIRKPDNIKYGLNWTNKWRDSWEPSPLSEGYKRTGYLKELEEFAESILSETEFVASLPHMVDVYKIIDKLEKYIDEETV